MSTDASWVATRAAAASADPLGRLEHVEDVHVRDVVQLVPAALAQRDHGEPDVGRVGDLGAGDGQRGLQRAGREVGQLGRRVDRPRRRGRGRGPRASSAGGGTRRGARRPHRRGPSSRSGCSLAGSAPTAWRSASRRAYAAGRVEPRNGSANSRHCSGCRHRWSASAWLAPSTDSNWVAVRSSPARAGTRPGLGPLRQPHQPGQCLVRIGGLRQHGTKALGVVAQPGELGGGLGGVLEPDPQQPGAHGVAAGAHSRQSSAAGHTDTGVALASGRGREARLGNFPVY